MNALDNIAVAAYSAHAKELQRLIGVRSRPWADLQQSEQKGWRAATTQILAMAAASGIPVPDIDAVRTDSIEPEPAAWVRDDNSVWLSLQLIGGYEVPFDAVAAWTDDECRAAQEWAVAVHYEASDNDVIVPSVPACVSAHKVPRWDGQERRQQPVRHKPEDAKNALANA